MSMKKVASIFSLFTLVLLVAVGYHTASGKQVVRVEYTPSTFSATVENPKLAATSYAIFEVETGKIIAAQNADQVAPIASVTKLFSGATALRFLPEDTEVIIASSDVAEEGRSGRLSVGEKYTYHELLFPLLLESSNDAAAVFERATTTDFIQKMNELAKENGALHTNFSDASGLSERNQASVDDLVILTSHLYKSEPHLFDITRLSQKMGPYVGWINNNPLNQEAYRGGKHGFTEAASRTAIALFDEEFSDESRTIGYVVLGSENLKTDVAKLRQFVQASVTLE